MLTDTFIFPDIWILGRNDQLELYYTEWKTSWVEDWFILQTIKFEIHSISNYFNFILQFSFDPDCNWGQQMSFPIVMVNFVSINRFEIFSNLKNCLQLNIKNSFKNTFSSPIYNEFLTAFQPALTVLEHLLFH